MARPLKNGLDYFPFDVSLYEDEKLIDVQFKYGPLGESIYTRLLCLVYKNGYYYRFESMDKLASILIRSIGTRWVRNKQTVIEVIGFLAKCNLFSPELMQRGVLTSRGIQLRYQAATERRQSNIVEYSLLEKNDFQEAVRSIPKNKVNVAETPINAAETPLMQAISAQSKVKESKVKESKADQSKVNQSKAKQSKADQRESVASAVGDVLNGLAGLAGKKNTFYASPERGGAEQGEAERSTTAMVHYPESVEEVQKELEKTLPPDKASPIAQKFYTYYTLLGWKDKAGNPVKDWRKVAKWWADNERETSSDAGGYVSEHADDYRSFIYNIDE